MLSILILGRIWKSAEISKVFLFFRKVLFYYDIKIYENTLDDSAFQRM